MISKIQKIIRLIQYHFHVATNKRVLLTSILLEFVVVFMQFHDGRKLIEEVGIKPEVNAFTVVWNDSFFMMVFFFLVVFSFSAIPFRDNSSQFIVIRNGAFLYVVSHIIYIIILAIINVVSLYVMIPIFLPYKNVTGDWGAFWGAVSQNTGDYIGLNHTYVSYRVFWDFTPGQAFISVFSICLLLNIMVGLFLYFLAIFRKKNLGVILLAFLITLGRMTSYFLEVRLYPFSPFNWLCLDVLVPQYNGVQVSVPYACSSLIIINVLLILCILIASSRKKEIL